MTIREIIQRVKSLYNQGVGYVDTHLSDRHIYNKLLSVRALLLQTKYRNSIKSIAYKNLITLNCVELIEAPPYECPCLPQIGCSILRTKHKLPELLSINYDYVIKSVTNITGDLYFDRTTWEAKKYISGNKYTSKKLDYYIQNDYLYLTANSKLKYITITALFKDPNESKKLNSCNDGEDNCIDIRDTEFLIEDDLIDMLIQQTFQEFLQIMKLEQIPQNNGEEQERNNRERGE